MAQSHRYILIVSISLAIFTQIFSETADRRPVVGSSPWKKAWNTLIHVSKGKEQMGPGAA